MFDSLKDWLKELIELSFKGMNETVKETVEILSSQDGLWVEMMDMVRGENGGVNVLQPFCYTIVGICLLIELAQTASKVDVMKWENGLKIGIKMVLAKVCIDEAPKFLEACYLQALKWIETFADEAKAFNFDSALATVCTWCVNNVSGMGSILGLFVIITLIFLGISVCTIIIKMTAYGRMFEIYSYLIVSPLPFAFLPLGTGDGFAINRMTANFIKNYIAACMQGVMMVIALYIYKKMFAVDKLLDQAKIIASAIWSLVLNWANNDLGSAVLMSSIMEMSFFMLMHAILQVVIVTKCSSLAKSMINAM